MHNKYKQPVFRGDTYIKIIRTEASNEPIVKIYKSLKEGNYRGIYNVIPRGFFFLEDISNVKIEENYFKESISELIEKVNELTKNH